MKITDLSSFFHFLSVSLKPIPAIPYPYMQKEPTFNKPVFSSIIYVLYFISDISLLSKKHKMV